MQNTVTAFMVFSVCVKVFVFLRESQKTGEACRYVTFTFLRHVMECEKEGERARRREKEGPMTPINFVSTDRTDR